MTPEANVGITLAATRLLTEVAPALPVGYGQGSIGTLAMTLFMAAQEFETAAETRVWENAEMRRLLQEGASWGPFKNATATEASLRISALNEVNQRLTSDLIKLHEALENDSSAEARPLETAILQYLKESSERRRLVVPSF